MDSLDTAIYAYYLTHFQDLPPDKQFHFASRLYLWSQDGQAKQLLEDLKPYFTADDKPGAALRGLYKDASENPSHGSKNASEIRAPYFEKYPMLKTYLVLLFRVAFLRTAYGIDARDVFGELCPADALQKQFDDLADDSKATAILSTHAVNFNYLYTRFILEDESAFDPATYLEIAHEAYDLSDRIHIQLLIYLYTHCIIGDSMFYYRAVPDKHLTIYRQMIDELAIVIKTNFSDINLDNKNEFLVCARMVGMELDLRSQIISEAERSVSSEGTYLVDKHNNNPQLANTSIDKSEHRNVLYLMANRPFTPLG